MGEEIMEMTNEQAAEIIKKYDVLGCGYCHQGGKEIEEAFNMAIKALQEQAENPHQTDIDDAWEQAKAKYSLCNRCTKQPNCDDGKRNLYMNECSRFVDVVDMPQSDSNEFYNMDAPLRKQMREPTTEELEIFDNYIKSISKPTGVNFWDLADGEYISRKALLEDLYKRDYTKFTHRDFVALVQYQDIVAIPPEHDGCKDCVYQDNPQDAMPCRECKQNYMNKWKARPSADMFSDLKAEISMYENSEQSINEMIQGIKSIISIYER